MGLVCRSAYVCSCLLAKHTLGVYEPVVSTFIGTSGLVTRETTISSRTDVVTCSIVGELGNEQTSLTFARSSSRCERSTIPSFDVALTTFDELGSIAIKTRLERTKLSSKSMTIVL